MADMKKNTFVGFGFQTTIFTRFIVLLVACTVTWADIGHCRASDQTPSGIHWPGWLGPQRDGWVEGFQPPAKWPEELKKGWQVDVGVGYSSPLVASGLVYQLARQGNDEVVWCLDIETGDVKWRQSYAVPFKASPGGERHGAGPKSSPVLADGRLFTMSITGDLTAWDAESGKRLWRTDYESRFQPNRPNWGVATSPIVDRDRVIAHFGNDKNGALVALDVKSGAEVWSQGSDGPSYSSPLVVEMHGVRQVVEWNHRALVGVDIETGRFLWEFPFPHIGGDQNMPTPVFHRGRVLLGGENRAIHCLEPKVNNGVWSVEQRWHQKEVALNMSTAVVNDELLFGFSHYSKGQFFCLDIQSGKVLWQGPGRTGDNVMFLSVPGYVVALINNGQLQIIAATGDRFDKVASYRVAENDTYAPPVPLQNGFLVKDLKTLTFWSLKRSATSLPSQNQALFERMDANSNGWVTVAETARWAQRRAARTGAGTGMEQAGEGAGQQVFPLDPAAVKARQRMLEPIQNVTDGGQRPPNIVVILADDLGYGDTSVYGSKSIPTPHIDALAHGGAQMTNAYVTAASCSPSRAGLMTGRYQQRFGFEFNTSGGQITHNLYRGLDPAAITLADVLKKAGYVTGMFGKWHLGTRPHFHPQSRGFDEFYGFLAGAHSFFPAKREEPVFSTIMRGHDPLVEPEYLTDAIARETVQFIDSHHNQPFFAYVPFNAVHTPIQATKKYQDRFPDESDVKRRDYYAMTSALDDAVGAIAGAIAKHELTRNTLVIFLNDNGGPMYTGVQSNGPLRMGKLFLFEGGVRVPMIVQWPEFVPPKTVFDGTTSSLDIFPTVCAAAGIDLPDAIALDGVDLLPFLSGAIDGAPHETLFWSNGPNVAVRKRHWKLVKSYDNVWLFDLSKDLGEKNNLAKTNPEIVEQLEQDLRQWKSQMAKPAWPSKPRRRQVPIDGMTYEMNI